MGDALTVVTQAWLIAMGKQHFPIESLIDREQGIVMLDHMVDSASATGEEEPGEVSASRLCGADLEKSLPALRESLTKGLAHADAMECHNKPGPPYCAFGVADEWAVFTYVIMRKTDDGHLVLDAIAGLDSGSMTAEPYARQGEWVATQLRKARSTNCAGAKQSAITYPRQVANRSR